MTRPSVLVCDDEPNLRELIRVSLGPGWSVHEAEDGEVALELARSLQPDLVILDLMMPRLTRISSRRFGSSSQTSTLGLVIGTGQSSAVFAAALLPPILVSPIEPQSDLVLQGRRLPVNPRGSRVRYRREVPEPPTPEELASALRDLSAWATAHAPVEESPLRSRLRDHLGCDPAELPVVSKEIPVWERANLQVALDAYLAAEGRSNEYVGLSAQHGWHMGLADQEEAGGDADDRPLAHLHGHVLLRAGVGTEADGEPGAATTLRALGELREAHVPAMLGREPDVLVRPALRREVGVERDLEVRALPHRDLLRNDRELGRIAAEVVADPGAKRRLLDRSVRGRPGGEIAQRARKLLGFQRLGHLPTVAQTASGGLTGSRRPCYNGDGLRLDRRSQDRREEGHSESSRKIDRCR